MKLLKQVFFGVANIAPEKALQRFSGIKLLLPYHHVVSDHQLHHIRHLYPYLNTRQFETQLDYLLANYKPLAPQEVLGCLKNDREFPSKGFLLSFDDGFRELHDIVAPILSRKGVPAIFFLNPAFIDNKELFYRSKLSLILQEATEKPEIASQLCAALGTTSEKLREAILKINYPRRETADDLGMIAELSFSDFLEKEKPFLTSEQVKGLHNAGFTIGAHSMDHPNYGLISLDEQIRQTRESVNWVKMQVGSCDWFSFPHADKPVSQEFFENMKDDSVVYMGTQNQSSERNNRVMHRFNAESPDRSIQIMVKSVHLFQALRKLAGFQIRRR